VKTSIWRSNLKLTAGWQRQRRRKRSVRRNQNSELEFTARLNERESVEFIIAAAKDENLPTRFRRQCALGIIKLARGPRKPRWRHDGQDIDLSAPGTAGFVGATVGDEFEAVQITTRLLRAVEDLIAADVPTDQWPIEILAPVQGLVDYYGLELKTAEIKP
jgi:hypothetical protein